MKIPTREDWGSWEGELPDYDIREAYEYFAYKSNDEVQAVIGNNITMRCSDFRDMPIKVFLYYIYGLKQFINSYDLSLIDNLDDICSGANIFIELIYKNARFHPEEIKNIYPDMKPLLEHMAENQELYDADEDIFGNFKEKVEKIKKILE